MSERTHRFDLKLLTTSKDVGLRRLRSYAASLGGGAQIFHSGEDLKRSLDATAGCREQSVIVHDTSVVLSVPEVTGLSKLARVFQLHQPRGPGDLATPTKGMPCWDLESYMRCSMGGFFDSPIVRMSMAHLCRENSPFQLEHLLRWGYAAQTWKAGVAHPKDSIADASMAFIRTLNLAGENRRVTEMASHFLQTRLAGLGLAESGVTFGSDGLTTIVIARCVMGPKFDLAAVAAELRIHDFPVAIVNHLEGGMVEIGTLYHPASGDERVLMMFRKAQAGTVAAEPPQKAQGDLRPKLGKVG